MADIRRNVMSALRALQRTAAGRPCSREFLEQMQRIAFRPDGLNEFLYAPNGIVECSTNRAGFASPVKLGTPDIVGSGTSPNLWIDKDFGPLGAPGAIGTIAEFNGFAVAIPRYPRHENGSPWLAKELVFAGPNGKVWNVAGNFGLYQRLAIPEHSSLVALLTTVDRIRCDGERLFCVATRADLLAWTRDWTAIPSSIAALAALFAWICAKSILSWLNRYWSFEARFSRHLDVQTVIVAYQPIVDLRSGEVSGCEVLARWRDVDGTIVAPDRFIEIVESTGRTADFTRIVADCAYEELHKHVPRHVRLQINFNIFPCDLDIATLSSIFARFNEGERRFDLGLELVENQEIEFENAQRAIQGLGRAGIKTYIDDFGTGYSSIERVATLAVHGVKLDRSFAMSRPDSILGSMLVQVLEMMKTSGRLIVVEGVETEARLNLLRSTGNVDYVQGFWISRPLGIHDLVAFLAQDEAARMARGFEA